MYSSIIALVLMICLTMMMVMPLLYIIKHRYKTGQLRYKPSKGVLPLGPTPWPIVGCLPQMMCNKRPTFQWIHLFMAEKGIEIACFRLGNIHVFPVTCPTIAKHFLRKQDAIFASRPDTMATRTLTGGYKSATLAPYGETSQKMRHILISEILSPERHRWLHDKRAQEANNLLKYLYNQSKNVGVVDVRMAARHYAGNVARRLIFNKRYFGMERQDGGPTFMEQEHIDAIFAALKYIYAFCISDYLPCTVGLDLNGHEEIIKQVNNTFLKYHQPIIDERIHKWRSSSSTDQIEIQDLLDVLISIKDSDGEPLLTREEITAQTMEITLAMIDNPANAAEWVLAEMISNQCIMSRALEEIEVVVGKDRVVDEQDVPNLNYIKACARESFRLHPIMPFSVPHVSLCDTVVAGYHIPKGSHILLSRMGLGRNPKVWDDPLKYKPERHLPNNNINVVSLTEPDLRFISFSTGRRGCIGITLGTTMTVMLLATMLQGFSWKAPPNVSQINLEESKDGLHLRQPLIASIEPRLPLHLYP